MKKPPPSRLNQQEPPYQSPPRPPPQQEPYQTQPPPPVHEQEPTQPPRRRRGPVITYIPAPRIINTPKEHYKSLVQRLTGLPPTSTAPPSSSPYTSAAPNYTSRAFEDSMAMEMYADLERTKPRPGFVGGGGGGDNQLPNLSPGTTSIWPELLSTTNNPQDLQFTDSLLPSPSLGNQQRHHQPPTSSIPHGDGGPLKRRRFDLDNDTRSIGSDYDMYSRTVQTPSLPSEEAGRFNGLGGMGRPGGDNMNIGGVFPSDFGANDTRAIGFGQQDLAGRPSQQLLHLPPDASSTLFVEGLPSNCSMREVAHIFRPFLGYKEVRLVTKDSTQWNGDPIILCFVDFENPACAAIARNELQGYRMDEEEPDSNTLQIQFSRNPGPRPG